MIFLYQTSCALSTVNVTVYDCYYVEILATSLLLNKTQPAIMNQVENDCCAVGTGVTCLNGRVISIVWSSLGLQGRF